MNTPVESIRRHHDELTELRRDIHAHPELGFEEARTAAIVAGKLREWGVEVHEGIGRTGVVGVLKNGNGGKTIGLRADMDCLPMHEQNDFAHASRHPGKMHACGHDGHTVMLLGAARHLAETRNFDGTVVFIFQPAEEGGGGGLAMVEDGLFTRFPMDAVYALHNWPALPEGVFAVRPGPVMAAADRFEIVVEGQGGHGAMPHLAVDPVVISAQIISAAQSIVSRNMSPADAGVVSFCSMHTPQLDAYNVIPGHVTLVGTVRSFRPESRDLLERRLREVVEGVAGALGGSATIRYERGYPATVNTPVEAGFAARVAAALAGEDKVLRDADPSMGAEDFAYMLEACPGAYVWLGHGGGACGQFLHNARYDFNDNLLPLGAGYLAALAEAALPAR